MENPYEILNERLSRIELMVEMLVDTFIKTKSEDQEDIVWTLEECSQMIKIPKSTLYKYTSERKIPYTKPGKHLLFNRKEIMEWLESEKRITALDLKSKSIEDLEIIGASREL